MIWEEEEGENEVMAKILKGPITEMEIPNITIGKCLFEALKEIPPDFTMLTEDTGKTCTASELLQQSVTLATALADLGVTKGDMVALVGANTIDLCISGIAVLLQGAVMCPVDPTLKSMEFQHILNVIQPKVIFTDQTIYDQLQDALNRLGLEVETIFVQTNGEDDLRSVSNILSNSEVDVVSFIPAECENNETEMAVVVCSSGTTGMPKGVAISHFSLMFQAIVGKAIWQKDLFMQTSYFYWITGVLALVGTTVSGVPRLLVGSADPHLVLESIDKFKPVYSLMSPSLLSIILQQPNFGDYDVSSLESVIVGGAPLNRALLQQFQVGFEKCSLKQAYGCSEVAGLISRVIPPTDLLSLGTVASNVQIKVIDTGNGESLGPEEEGEICCKTPSLMIGYLRNEDATKQAVDEDGWYHTGDIGKYTEEGVLYLTGRAKELMKVDSHQISPEEIEAVIALVPGVKDCAVAGITVEENNLPMALVVKEQSADVCEEDIIQAVEESLSEFKQIRAGVHFVDAIPHTSTGKLKRRQIQEMADALYA